MKRFVFCMMFTLALAMVMPATGCTEKLTLTAEEYYQRGESLANEGKYEDAIKDYTRAIQLDANDPRFYVNRGTAYLNMNKLDLAIDDLRKAIELNPDLAIAYANLGTAYAKKGGMHINRAIMAFNKVIMISKDAELIAYAKEKQKEIKSMTVVSSGGGGTTSGADTSSSPGNIVGIQEDNTSQAAAITSTWRGTINIVGRRERIEQGFSSAWNEYDAKGEFSFNILSISEIGYGEISGSGTAQGSYSARHHANIGSSEEFVEEELGNFNTIYKVGGIQESLEENYIYLSFHDCEPSESTRTITRQTKYERRTSEGTFEFLKMGFRRGSPTGDEVQLGRFELRDGAIREEESRWSYFDDWGTIRTVITIYKVR
ncbi:tetratricopeptide repeat protein [Chloroflexota bacterium]